MSFQIFNKIDKTFVINLKKDTLRKEHVIRSFSSRKIDFEFIDAVDHNNAEVKELYIKNMVHKFPPCFRCKENRCNHENNFITPKQVANFLSFKKIMKKISDEKIANAFIFEDDFYFKFFARISFKKINSFIENKQLLEGRGPILLRIGSHTRVSKKYYLKLLLFNKVSFLKNKTNDMANPCFLINLEFANLFLEHFPNIDMTSDAYIHTVLPNKTEVENFSVYPFCIGQYSYGNRKNRFSSSITSSQNESENFSNTNFISEYQDYDLLKQIWINS
jgi:GR25 family glycosyltransferase involved in LPS biosynthesis